MAASSSDANYSKVKLMQEFKGETLGTSHEGFDFLNAFQWSDTSLLLPWRNRSVFDNIIRRYNFVGNERRCVGWIRGAWLCAAAGP